MNTKQVIVIRKDLNMRKGKIAAQASHASMAFLSKYVYVGQIDLECPENLMFQPVYTREERVEIAHWLSHSFRKICVYVNSEYELKALHQKALDNGLISNIIEDNGATEFNGIKTVTCVAIGPHYDEKFIGITDQLPLL